MYLGDASNSFVIMKMEEIVKSRKHSIFKTLKSMHLWTVNQSPPPPPNSSLFVYKVIEVGQYFYFLS